MIQTVLPPWKPVLRVLGAQKDSHEAYRPFRYSLRLVLEDSAVFFHVLTREMAAVPLAEESAPETRQWLKEHRFLVPENTDDYKIALQTRSVLRLLIPRQEGYSAFEILTTTDCNARCPYCYEKGCARTDMTPETADAAAAFIGTHSAGRQVTLKWFGGEPLCNPPVIDRICARLQSDGVPYVSVMVSNGSLFDGETVKKAVSLWRLKHVKVTLDGTEPVYNKVKAYVFPEGNMYRKVMENISGLLDAGISVTVRLNLDRYNADDLLGLADELGRSFAGRGGIDVITVPLFESTLPADRIAERREVIYSLQEKLEDRIRAAGLSVPGRLRRRLDLFHCQADGNMGVTIQPDGRLGICGFYPDRETFGSVFSGETDPAVIRKWREPAEDLPACRTCVSFPECVRIRHCPMEPACCPELQALRNRALEESVRREYELWKHAGGPARTEDGEPFPEDLC